MRCFYVIQHIKGTKPGFWMYDKLSESGFEIIPFYAFKTGDVEKMLKRNLRNLYNIIVIFLSAKKEDLIFYYDNMGAAAKLAFLYWVFGIHHDVYCGNMMGFDKLSKFKAWIIKKSFNNLHVAVNSYEMKNRQIRLFGIKENHICVIPDCIALYTKEFEKKYNEYIKDDGYIFMGGEYKERLWNVS